MAETLTPLTEKEARDIFNSHWMPAGVRLDENSYAKLGDVTYCTAYNALGE